LNASPKRSLSPSIGLIFHRRAAQAFAHDLDTAPHIFMRKKQWMPSFIERMIGALILCETVYYQLYDITVDTLSLSFASS
jgi:hypothetical protein